MAIKESDIEFEGGDFWVLRVGTGHYEVLERRNTHSVKVSTFHFRTQAAYALSRAITDCQRRDRLKGN